MIRPKLTDRIKVAIKALSGSMVPSSGVGWNPIIREPFTGAWQRNKEESVHSVLTYPTLFACIRMISKGIGKLPFTVKRINDNGIWELSRYPEIDDVLRKPNHFQNQIQFRESWMMSNLTQGNAYILKERENGRVVRLYVLNPYNIQPLVSPSGSVFYELLITTTDPILGFEKGQTIRIPSSEIMHDRPVTLHHPLVGVPPVCAAYWPAVKNLKILRNAASFFGNAAQPGGILTAPGEITDTEAKRLKDYWDDNFTGRNAGSIAVVGGGLSFESLSANAADSQMVEQMKYSDEQITQAFGLWPFLVGLGGIPAGMKIDDMMQMYYTSTLQSYIESMETLLDEGLDVPRGYGVELDLEPLLRMDEEKKATVQGNLVKAAISTIDEARAKFDLSPIEGGDTAYLQQQNYSLAALAKRDAREDPFGAQTATRDATQEERGADSIAAIVEKKFEEALNEL